MVVGLLDSDIDAGNIEDEDVGNPDAQCHYTFQNVNQTVFQPLVNDNYDRPFVVMAFGTLESKYRVLVFHGIKIRKCVVDRCNKHKSQLCP